MRIFNAFHDRSSPFDNAGKPLHQEWPENGSELCSRKCDQELFAYLEKTKWPSADNTVSSVRMPDIVCASARWDVQIKDDVMPSPLDGTLHFWGSGIYFWSDSTGRFGEKEKHFLCEVPWAEIFDKIGENQFHFVGEERMKDAIRAKIDVRIQKLKAETDRLQEKLYDAMHKKDCCSFARSFIQ